MRRYTFLISYKYNFKEISIYAGNKNTAIDIIIEYCNKFGYTWIYKSVSSKGTLKGKKYKEYDDVETHDIEIKQLELIKNMKRGALDNV